MTEAEARAAGRRCWSAQRPMTRVARAIEKGETQGFMKILVDADTKRDPGRRHPRHRRRRGGPSALDLMYAKAPYDVMQRAVHIHPTVSELVPTILGELKPVDGPA